MTLKFGSSPGVVLLLLVASCWFQGTLSLPGGRISRHAWPSNDEAAVPPVYPGTQMTGQPGQPDKSAVDTTQGAGGTLIPGSGSETSGQTPLIRHRRQDPPPDPPVPPDPPIPIPPDPPVPPDPPTSTGDSGGGGSISFNPFGFFNPFNAFGQFGRPGPQRFRGPYYVRRSYYNPDPITSFFDQIASFKRSILDFFF